MSFITGIIDGFLIVGKTIISALELISNDSVLYIVGGIIGFILFYLFIAAIYVITIYIKERIIEKILTGAIR